MNYKPNRIGFINFWLYDEEEYYFEDGKLLLTGLNASGKSVTMQSFIPLILDGNKAPSRLDPFGGKEKRIEDYLIGSSDGPQKDESTGYLYLELYHLEKKKYMTIGLGLHAKKGRPTDSWGFIIQDGKRVGKDIFLYKSLSDKIPCTRKELRAKLGPDNIFAENAKEYKAAVNKALFGFPNLDMYDEFINLLLQLRSPKLSKDYKPTKLMGILSGVLKPLTEEDLRPLSEAIEEMDKTKEKIEKLEFDVKQLSNLLITYNNYNETMLYKKAENYLAGLTDEEDARQNLDNLKKEIEIATKNFEENKTKSQNLEIEKESLETKRANLDSRDLEAKLNRFQNLNGEIEAETQRKEEVQNDLNNQLNKIKDIQNKISSLTKDKEKREIECAETYSDIKDLSEEIKFEECADVLEDYNENKDILNQFTALKTRLNNYKNKLENIKKEIETKEKLETKRNEIDEELNLQNKNYSEIIQKLDKNKDEISEEILNIKDKIAYLGKTNEIIKLTSDEVQDIIKPFEIYEKTSYQNSKQKYLNLSTKIRENLISELYKIQNKIENQTAKIKEISEKLDELKSTRELTLNRDEEEKQTVLALNERKIKYVEFYKAIEFKDNLEEKTKDKLESNLLSSGLLNAFIISDLSQVKDLKGIFITKGKKLENNLTKYFKPVHNAEINENEIIKILESISTDQNAEITLNENYFQVNFMRVQGSSCHKSAYIGILAREKAKELKIKEIENQKETEEDILKNLEKIRSAKEIEITKSEAEEKLFPQPDTLDNLNQNLYNLNIHLEIITKQKTETETKLENIETQIETVFKKLMELKKDLNFPLYLETFTEAIENTNILINTVSDFAVRLNSLNTLAEQIASANEQISERTSMADDLSQNLAHITSSLTKKEYERQELDKILNSDEYKDLSAQIIKLDKRLKEIDEERLNIKESCGKLAESLEIKKQRQTLQEQEIEKVHFLTTLKEEFFKKEYELHYVEDLPFENPKILAKKIITKLSARKYSDSQNVTDNYYKAYNDYRTALNDYHLNSKIIFTKEEVNSKFLDVKTLNELYSQNTRADLTAMYQGKILNIYSLSKALTDAIDENNQIISEQDRHLFEEILLKTVGAKIRERIESSRNWVKEINQIMKKMQEGSSLSFGLEWRSKSAESMDELETKELVRIFQIDASMVTKEDSDKLINHFRSKLKRLTEMNNDSDTYSSVIFEVLDYRNWFEFKINYQRTGDTRKELTDKVFSIFSGGEKAKTMYIPLFAAVYAKLMSAKKDAPRLIALDEAFAGVDDTNIREMFGILASLNLDYILTSQALWGDYDTIKGLAIAELIRPDNAQVVSVRWYRWNGKTRERINDKEILDAS